MQTATHHATSALTIVNTSVRQHDGLYSLNDLHQAAGGEAKHKPANFMRLDTTQALVAEIQVSDVSLAEKTIHGGNNRGTYVCKELVYAYAMWISPAFHLKVIRAFDALQTGAVPPAPTFPTMVDALGIYRDSVQALLLTHDKPAAHLLACRSATRITGIDLTDMWQAPPVAGNLSSLPPLPWGSKPKKPVVPSRHEKQLTRLARYLRHPERLAAYSTTYAVSRDLIADLLAKGYIARQVLLKRMHCTAAEFNLLIAEGKEAGIVRELDGIEFNYAGTVYVAGGAA